MLKNFLGVKKEREKILSSFGIRREIEIILFLNDKKKPQNINILQKEVWSYASDLETHTVETHIYRLRKKINKNIFTKSGIMVGLGENKDEILQVMDDLRSADVDFLTIGQYLQPSKKHHPLDRYYKPEEFDELKLIAESKGFLLVSSSPLTRSSYHADEDFAVLQKNRINQTNAQSIS